MRLTAEGGNLLPKVVLTSTTTSWHPHAYTYTPLKKEFLHFVFVNIYEMQSTMENPKQKEMIMLIIKHKN